jgi:hypothetical protein
MRTFDLRAALRGEKVVTRDGREVTTVLQPNGVTDLYTVAAVVDGEIETYTSDGHFHGSKSESGCDLFMASKTVTVFCNIYRDATGEAYTGQLYETAADAEMNATGKTRIAVATVTWEA